MPLDFSEAPLPPFQHQVEDTESLLTHPYYFIASEMRTGKTKIVIDAAQFLYRQGAITRVIVVCPAPVRGVWWDPEMGEIHKHAWASVPMKITEYHSRPRQWMTGPPSETPLYWIVTNYEFIRSEAHVKTLLKYAHSKTLLVLDESSAITAHKSKQFKACYELRKSCGRVVLLNGTPFDTPMHLFAQGNMLHPSILECGYKTHFLSRYAKMGGYAVNGRPVQIQQWINMDDLQRRFAPYTVRRLQKDCLDVPDKLPPVTLTATLTPQAWAIYKDMRDQMVVWLEKGRASVAPHAITKIMRLAQITSGFLGGIEDTGIEGPTELDWNDNDPPPPPGTVREIGREKLDVVLWLIEQQLQQDPNLKAVVWVRFRAELARLLDEAQKKFPAVQVAGIMGGQKKDDRRDALQLLHPSTAPPGPVIVGGTYGTGSFGLDFSASHTSIACSYDYSLRKFLQSGDRVYSPSQKFPVAYYDIVATGPKGQKTIDHILVRARRAKEDLATWTTGAWVRALRDEGPTEHTPSIINLF